MAGAGIGTGTALADTVSNNTSDTGADAANRGNPYAPLDPAFYIKVAHTQALLEATQQQLALGATQDADLTSADVRSAGAAPQAACADICPAPAADVVSTQPNDNQTKSYYCGPASSHNVLGSMGVSVSQATLAADEDTEMYHATPVDLIPKAMNMHQNQDKFGVVVAQSPGDLMAHVQWDVWYQDHSLVLYVDPFAFPRWNGHHTGHYDVAYRYDTRNLGHIKIAEEWDPNALGIYTSYGDPYGKWWATLNQTWEAIGGRGDRIVY
jgi:hypothetical protein